MALPSHMRVVRLEAYHEDVTEAIRSLHVVEQPVPKPGRGQVLVKIEATPCNPSDLLFLQGKYGQLKKLPAVPGWEGAGTVVASGHGWLAGWLNNRRVACGAAGDRDGTWAEYFLANAKFEFCRYFDRSARLVRGGLWSVRFGFAQPLLGRRLSAGQA
ncbi:MAG: alcohol dehydrogenase catalytic domain-containing protein, partial [Pirellulaceae bacterium]